SAGQRRPVAAAGRGVRVLAAASVLSRLGRRCAQQLAARSGVLPGRLVAGQQYRLPRPGRLQSPDDLDLPEFLDHAWAGAGPRRRAASQYRHGTAAPSAGSPTPPPYPTRHPPQGSPPTPRPRAPPPSPARSPAPPAAPHPRPTPPPPPRACPARPAPNPPTPPPRSSPPPSTPAYI